MSATLKPSSESAELVYVRQGGDARALPELSLVEMLANTPTDAGVTMPAGAVGTIVLVHGNGKAYEVEFAEPLGALATVMAQNLRPTP